MRNAHGTEPPAKTTSSPSTAKRLLSYTINELHVLRAKQGDSPA